MDRPRLLALLKSELERSTGCTDPGAVALAVSRARRELGAKPDAIEVIVSPNVFKNGVGVGIPGTGKRGLVIAAALGASIDRHEAGLAIFEHVTPEVLARAEAEVAAGRVRVRYAESPDPLYIRAELHGGEHSAHAIIAGDYSDIVEVGRDGKVVLSRPRAEEQAKADTLLERSLESLFGLLADASVDELEFFGEVADINEAAARVGLGDERLRLGRSLARTSSELPQPFAAIRAAQVWTAAASEARMAGLPVTVMAIAGSGNHGITFSLGIAAVAKELGSSRERLLRALAIGALVTVVIKCHVHRMTAFCGCSIAASTGVAAGVVHLLGGDFAASEGAMQSVVGTLSGMLCDGAKESCAYKLSTSASFAIQSAYAAIEGVSIPRGMGVVGRSIEESFANLGVLNESGMATTDRVVLGIIEKN